MKNDDLTSNTYTIDLYNEHKSGFISEEVYKEKLNLYFESKEAHQKLIRWIREARRGVTA